MSERPRVFDSHFHYLEGDGGNVDVIRKLLDDGMVEGILCCSSLRAEPKEALSANRPLIEAAARYGKKKLPLLAAVHPNRNGWKDALSSLLDASNEIVGIKLHPPIGKYDVTPETVGPVFEMAAERKLIVASHTCPVPGRSAVAFLPVLERFAEVTFIIYHASTHEEAAYLSMRKNVHVEPSWLGFFKPLFDMVGKLGGYRKLLAGTDGPGWFANFDGDPYDDLAQLARGMLPGEEEVRMFLYENAAALLGL